MKQQSFLLALAFVFASVTLFSQDFNIQLRSTLDYPGQNLANICGYAQNGQEYALVAASKGLSIVNVTDPDNPVQVVQIPRLYGVREIKVYKHYAYATSDYGGGVLIVDLSNLPDTSLDYHQYMGTGDILDLLHSIHTLHIEVAKGYLYTYSGIVHVHDLNTDPYNPTYAGLIDQLASTHDGYVDNDTLYAAEMGKGRMSVVDMRDKANPVLLGSVETPARFTHNTWMLNDRKTVLTTDEHVPSFLTAYDVSDPTDIKELDRFSPNDGNGSIGHNTHIINNWAVTSWYLDGLNIVDASRPGNLIMMGQYDTWPNGTGPTFGGCFGVYPYLPSGNLLATNMSGRLFILTPTYKRASYVEGQVLNGCNGKPLAGAEVRLIGTAYSPKVLTQNNGVFKTGLAQTGTVQAIISKAGYIDGVVNLNLVAGKVTTLNFSLQPVTDFDLAGKAVDKLTGTPLANKALSFAGPIHDYLVQTDANGLFDLECIAGGNYRVGTWGYRVADLNVASDGLATVWLDPAYYDDFEFDLGWTKTATALDGFWELGNPLQTHYNQYISSPGDDANFDNSNKCYVTGNSAEQYASNVDKGTVTLTSPVMRLAGQADAKLSFEYWFFKSGFTGQSYGKFEAMATNGQQTVTIFTVNHSESAWRPSGDIYLKDYLPLTDSMQIMFVASDIYPYQFIEAAVDVFEVTLGVVSVPEQDPTAVLAIAPNPSSDDFALRYDWPGVQHAVLDVCNLLGQTVLAQPLAADRGTIRFGRELPKGVYVVVLRSESRQSAVVKVLKN